MVKKIKFDAKRIEKELYDYELTNEQKLQIYKLMTCRKDYMDVESYINALIRFQYFNTIHRIEEVERETRKWNLTSLEDFYKKDF